MTLDEFFELLKGYSWRQKKHNDELISLSWYTAAFTRCDKLPSLERLLSKVENQKPQTPEQIESMVHLLNQAFGGSVTYREE
jgi:hypothetical protein